MLRQPVLTLSTEQLQAGFAALIAQVWLWHMRSKKMDCLRFGATEQDYRQNEDDIIELLFFSTTYMGLAYGPVNSSYTRSLTNTLFCLLDHLFNAKSTT